MDHTESLPDIRWARYAGAAGIASLVSYAALIFLDSSLPVGVLLCFGFSFGLATASIGLHLGVTGRRAPALSLLGAVCMVVAAAELLAMLLVQSAVKAAVPHPGEAMTAIWLGLDVAWDLFGGVGTLLFGIALFQHPAFGRVLAAAGVVIAALLLALNVATFPTPPGEAGSVDVGPLLALWFLLAFARVLWLARPAGITVRVQSD